MPDVWAQHSEKVIAHFKNPGNVGEIDNPDGIGHVGNPVCGDIVEVHIEVNDGIIVDAKFKTSGCGAAIATSSMVTEMAKGKNIQEALPAAKMHCPVMAEEALKAAIDDYPQRHGAVGTSPTTTSNL
jgi:nitrogen fixation NifU-like protein